MKTIMMVVLTAVIVTVQSVALASGEIIRKDNLAMWRTPTGYCLVINLDTLKAKLPTEWTPALSVLTLGLKPLRPMTAEEEALCKDTEVVELSPPDPVKWVVHRNKSGSRPAYIYTGRTLVKHKSIRATVGEPCGRVVSPTDKSLQYRYLWKYESDNSLVPFKSEGVHLVAYCRPL